jgi:hypothetical protein
MTTDALEYMVKSCKRCQKLESRVWDALSEGKHPHHILKEFIAHISATHNIDLE